MQALCPAEIGDHPGASMVPVEEGELPKEGRVASRGGRGQEEEEEGEFVAAGAADGAAGVGGRLGGSQRQPSDQGLEKLERAKGLLLEGGARVNIGDVSFCAFFLPCNRAYAVTTRIFMFAQQCPRCPGAMNSNSTGRFFCTMFGGKHAHAFGIHTIADSRTSPSMGARADTAGMLARFAPLPSAPA